MIPKEKAKEIVKCYYRPLTTVKLFYKYNTAEMWTHAQSCAKTAVALILNSATISTENARNIVLKGDIDYWQKVLEEIDNV